MSRVKISVIVPVYNAEKYLRRCVDSILAQTFTDFELLLVDDGSTDASGAICDEYASADARVRVFHKPNGGVSSARNLGLDNARGEWIAFADADDYLLPKWSVVASSELKNVDMVVAGIEIRSHNNSTERVAVRFEGTPKEWMENGDASKMRGALWNKFFRHDVVSNHLMRLDTRFNVREDEEFVVRFLTHVTTVKSVDLVVYHYFEPDWGLKYSENFRHLNTFWLVAELQKSYHNIGLSEATSLANLKELKRRVLYNSWHDPLSSPKYFMAYFKIRTTKYVEKIFGR